MNAFDTAAVLIAIAALTGYINHRVLKLSATTGTLAVALGGAARPRPAGWKPTARSWPSTHRWQTPGRPNEECNS